MDPAWMLDKRERAHAEVAVEAADARTAGAGGAASSARQGAILLLLLLGLGLVVRLHGIGVEPVDFHPTRQYRSANITRDVLYAATEPAGDPRRVAAAAARDERLEVPINEYVVAGIYWASGGERLWVAQLLGAAWWLAGGAALWATLRRMTSLAGQITGTSLYLFIPMAVAGSRSFQPDPMMVGASLVAIWLLTRAAERPNLARLLPAVMATGLAVLVKPTMAAMVVLWWVALAASRRRSVPIGRVVLVLVLAALPSVGYYLWGALAGGSLDDQGSSSFVPSLFTTTAFYRATWTTMTVAVPAVVLVGAVVALAFVPRAPRRPVVALWVGYVAIHAIANYRTATHDYYHLPLIVVVAVTVAAVIPSLERRVSGVAANRRVSMAGAILLAILFGTVIAGGWQQAARADRTLVEANEEIGRLTGNSPRVLALTIAYGKDLSYDGHVAAAAFPSASDRYVDQLLGTERRSAQEIILSSGADWFAITSLEHAAQDRELREALATYRVAGRGPTWVLYDLRATDGRPGSAS